jgi:hypothetical protein
MAMFEIHNPLLHGCHLNEVHGNQYYTFTSFAREIGMDPVLSWLRHWGVESAHPFFLQVERETIAEWLSPLNFETHQATTFRKRTEDTGTWLLESTAFEEWRDGTSRTLFCPGIRECHCVAFLLSGPHCTAEQLALARP